MIKVNSFDEALHYVNRLGFTVKPGFPGWIPAAQTRLCNTTDALYNAAGREYPYTVHYYRKRKEFVVNGSVVVDAGRL